MTNGAASGAEERRKIEVVESNRIPSQDILFGLGPTVPFIIGAAAAWWLPQPSRMISLQFVALWGSAILALAFSIVITIWKWK